MRRTTGSRKPLPGGKSKMFFIFPLYILTGPFIREIPDLPRMASRCSKKKKKNLSKIKGHIMDPITRSAAQRVAKKAAQNQVEVASGDREESEVDTGEREEPEFPSGELEVANRE